MLKPYLSASFLAFAMLTACSAQTDGADTEVAASEEADDVRELSWEELVPEGEEERLAEIYAEQLERVAGLQEGGAGDVATQIGSFTTVPEFDGTRVRLPGYTVPFDYGVDAEITEFLLVPYFGACLHAPPPPPNQTIYVKTSSPIKLIDLAQAVWVEGTLRTTRQETELADAAYTIELAITEDYYSQP